MPPYLSACIVGGQMLRSDGGLITGSVKCVSLSRTSNYQLFNFTPIWNIPHLRKSAISCREWRLTLSRKFTDCSLGQSSPAISAITIQRGGRRFKGNFLLFKCVISIAYDLISGVSCNGVLPVWPARMPKKAKGLRWKFKQPGKRWI